MKKNAIVLTGKTLDELKEFVESQEESKFRAQQLFEWLYKFKVSSFDEMTNLSNEFRGILNRVASINSITLVNSQTSKIDGTSKFLFKLFDGNKIESVLILPRETAVDAEKRLTICISTQVGCPLDCKFCATASMGFTRNLTAGEIIEQIIFVEKFAGKKITNVVFMGMGEPMLNYKEVMKACDLLTDNKGMSITPKKITISTAGYVDGIKKMADEKRKMKLALSLHSLDDKTRIKIMPITKKYSVEELIKSLKYYSEKTGFSVMLEYILFSGLNDTEKDIALLTKLHKRIPMRINIIPFHNIEFTKPKGIGHDLKSASREEIKSFSAKLQSNGVLVFTRNSSGADIDAACGQLAISSK